MNCFSFQIAFYIAIAANIRILDELNFLAYVYAAFTSFILFKNNDARAYISACVYKTFASCCAYCNSFVFVKTVAVTHPAKIPTAAPPSISSG